MARRRPPNRNQLSLLDWTPKVQPPVKRFEAEAVRAATLKGEFIKAMKLAAEDCGKKHEEIAAGMSAFLQETVSKSSLDGAMSEAREDHTINVVRFVAFVHATGDMRLLNLIAKQFGHICVEERWLGAVEEAQWTAAEEEAHRNKHIARRRWKGAP